MLVAENKPTPDPGEPGAVRPGTIRVACSREGLGAALAALADGLLAHDVLEGEQVEEILEDWL